MTFNANTRRLFVAAMLIISSISTALAFEIIPLRHQSADQLIPVLRPLLSPDSVVTGTGYKLIVKTTPQQLAKLRQLIQQLDTPVQQLIISVSHDQNTHKQKDQQNLAGSISGNDGSITVGQPRKKQGLNVNLEKGDAQIHANISQRQSQLQRNISQQVKVLSGSSAFIQTGQSVPIPQRQVILNGNRTIVSKSVQYQDVNTGFYVTPRVVGTQVSLEISTQRQNTRQGFNQIDQQHVSTQVQGQLGEWIELGTVEEVMQTRQSGILNQKNRSARDSQRVFVKVDTAPNSPPPTFKRSLN